MLINQLFWGEFDEVFIIILEAFPKTVSITPCVINSQCSELKFWEKNDSPNNDCFETDEIIS